MVLAGGEDEGAGQLHHADIATGQTPNTSKSLVVLQVENDKLWEENEKLKKQLGKQKQTLSFSQIFSNPDRVQYFTAFWSSSF